MCAYVYNKGIFGLELHYEGRLCLAKCSLKQASTRCLGYFGATGRLRCLTSRRTAFGSSERLVVSA